MSSDLERLDFYRSCRLYWLSTSDLERSSRYRPGMRRLYYLSSLCNSFGYICHAGVLIYIIGKIGCHHTQTIGVSLNANSSK